MQEGVFLAPFKEALVPPSSRKHHWTPVLWTIFAQCVPSLREALEQAIAFHLHRVLDETDYQSGFRLGYGMETAWEKSLFHCGPLPVEDFAPEARTALPLALLEGDQSWLCQLGLGPR